MQQLNPVQSAEREIFYGCAAGVLQCWVFFIANLGSGFTWYSEANHFTGPMLFTCAGS